MAAATATVTINDIETGQRYFTLYVTVVLKDTYETGGVLIGKLAAKSYISPKKPIRGIFNDSKGHRFSYIPATNKLMCFDHTTTENEVANTVNFTDGSTQQGYWVTSNVITGILWVPKA